MLQRTPLSVPTRARPPLLRHRESHDPLPCQLSTIALIPFACFVSRLPMQFLTPSHAASQAFPWRRYPLPRWPPPPPLAHIAPVRTPASKVRSRWRALARSWGQGNPAPWGKVRWQCTQAGMAQTWAAVGIPQAGIHGVGARRPDAGDQARSSRRSNEIKLESSGVEAHSVERWLDPGLGSRDWNQGGCSRV